MLKSFIIYSKTMEKIQTVEIQHEKKDTRGYKEYQLYLQKEAQAILFVIKESIKPTQQQQDNQSQKKQLQVITQQNEQMIEKKQENKQNTQQEAQNQKNQRLQQLEHDPELLSKVKKLLNAQKKLEVAVDLFNKEGIQTMTWEHIDKLVQQLYAKLNYQPKQQQIVNRLDKILESQSNWTDATGTVNEEDEEIWVVDDDVINAMQQQSSSQEQQSEQQGKQQMKQVNEEQEVNLQQLQQQFVVGGQSDHIYMLGKHQKFCVSVTSNKEILVSGGGDDQLFFYKLQQLNNQKNDKTSLIKPYHIVKHNQTINKISFAYDGKHVLSLTDKQLLCTEVDTLKTDKVDLYECADFCCHKSGNVFAVASGYEAYIYNIKGLSQYSSYTLDAQVNFIEFDSTGKNLITACDNKLRIISPKTSQVIKVGGQFAHAGEITCLNTADNFVLSGCIDGYVCVTSLKNNSIVGRSQKHNSTVNHLFIAQNYFLCGCAENQLYWYDVNKVKQIFRNDLGSSPTKIISLEDSITYVVGTLKGNMHIFDKRNPMKQAGCLRAGNTIHDIWHKDGLIYAGCEDGVVRVFDRKMLV